MTKSDDLRTGGWVERSETHHSFRGRKEAMGFAALNPSYAC
jgi:hypothetical protein